MRLVFFINNENFIIFDIRIYKNMYNNGANIIIIITDSSKRFFLHYLLKRILIL